VGNKKTTLIAGKDPKRSCLVFWRTLLDKRVKMDKEAKPQAIEIAVHMLKVCLKHPNGLFSSEAADKHALGVCCRCLA